MTKACEHYRHYVWDTTDARQADDDREIGRFALRQMERRLRQLLYWKTSEYAAEVSRIAGRGDYRCG